MAVIFGSPREKTATPGEKAVLKMFRSLDDDCIVHAQPELCGGVADFVVILPSIGVFVAEVKDWDACSIRAESGKIFLSCDGEWKQTQHPHDLAGNYEKCLREGLRKSKTATARGALPKLGRDGETPPSRTEKHRSRGLRGAV